MANTTKKTKETRGAKRAYIRRFLDRSKRYTLTALMRKLRKEAGVAASRSEIISCLNHMQKEGQIVWCFEGSLIIGETL